MSTCSLTVLRMIAGLALALIALGSARAQGNPPTAGLLFTPPDIASPALSPSGNLLAFVRHDSGIEGAVDEIIVFDLSAEGSSGRTLPTPDPVNWVQWANEDRLLISMSSEAQMRRGWAIIVTPEGNLRIVDELPLNYITSIRTDGSDPVMLFGENRRVTINQTTLDYVVDFLPDDPEHILLGIRRARHGNLDVYRTNVETGRARRVDSGRTETLAWFTNREGVTVMRMDLEARRRSVAVLIRERDGQRWQRVANQPVSNFSELQEGVKWIARTDRINEALVSAVSPETGTLGLFSYDLLNGEIIETQFLHPDYDLSSVFVDPISQEALALSWADERYHIESFDPEVAGFLPALADALGDDVIVTPVQRAGDRILIYATGPTEPGTYYVFTISANALEEIGPYRMQLSASALAPVSVHRYTARDGQALFGYLTQPVYPAADPVPLVVLPHGGPEARDHYAFDPLVQIIAADGFAVFQPQFRGSIGFGREFAEAGYGEWGGLIQDDILDGVESLVEAGLVDPDRICMAGWSFGGYSALMQAALNTERYRCAVAGAPVTDLNALLAYEEDAESDEPQVQERLRAMLGADDPERMAQFSPVTRASEMTLPVLLVHGEHDQIVPIEQSYAMLEALEAEGAQVELFEFDGGHSLAEEDDLRRASFQITRFLRKHLDPR